MIDPRERAAGLARAFVEPACAVMRAHHLVAVVLSGPHEERFVDVIAEASVAARGHSEKLAVMLYLTPKAKPPDSSSRKRYTALMNANAADANGTAYVVPAKGFAGSIQRSVLVGINAVSHNKMPTTVVSNHADAQDWFVAKGVRVSDARELERMVTELMQKQAGQGANDSPSAVSSSS